VFRLADQGQPDDKILAVPATDPLFEGYRALTDVPPHFLNEMEHFFSVYKDLEQKTVEGRGWKGVKKAYEAIEQAAARYHNHVK